MLIIGIAGGSGSGKTTVVKAITEQLNENVVVIPQDSYYKDLSHYTEEQKRVHNFDHPDSIDFDLLRAQLKELREGKAVDQPVYSYITCGRSKNETVRVTPADVIIVEGILIFTDPKLRKLMDIKIFVDADDDDRLMRVMARDIVERGKTVEWVIERYSAKVNLCVYHKISSFSRTGPSLQIRLYPVMVLQEQPIQAPNPQPILSSKLY